MNNIGFWYQNLTLAKSSHDDDDYGEENDLVVDHGCSSSSCIHMQSESPNQLLALTPRHRLPSKDNQDLCDIKTFFQSHAEPYSCSAFEKRKASETIRLMETEAERDQTTDDRCPLEEISETSLSRNVYSAQDQAQDGIDRYLLTRNHHIRMYDRDIGGGWSTPEPDDKPSSRENDVRNCFRGRVNPQQNEDGN